MPILGPLSIDASSTSAKRKHAGDEPIASKKQRITGHSQNPQTPAVRPHKALIDQLSPRYEIKSLSVQTSTSITKHIDKALQHLSRFSAWDTNVLPGVVLLYAKSEAASKLITVCETVKRRIAEDEQKWYQYNVLSEVEVTAPTPGGGDLSVVEDTMAMDDGGQGHDRGDSDDDYFETLRAPTVFERAVEPPKIRHKAFMSTFISRVPVAELKSLCTNGAQSNEDHIEHVRRKRMGLV